MFQNIPVFDAVVKILSEQGLGEITSATLVTGGNINQLRRIQTTPNISFILKQSDGTTPHLFECEAAGLQTLRKAWIVI